MENLRDEILRGIKNKIIKASIIADDSGILVGIPEVIKESKRLGLSIENVLEEGDKVNKGDEIIQFFGSPIQVAEAEDILMGLMAKPSGIATASYKAVHSAGGRMRIVCGAWKKMPLVLKNKIRRAIAIGGVMTHISFKPFLYLDKNYIEMYGGIKNSLRAVETLKKYLKVVQLKGRYNCIEIEALDATLLGANILFIDTGRPLDVTKVVGSLIRAGLRNRVKIAFGGNIRLEFINELKSMDIDLLCIGRQIVDAPLLDMKLDVFSYNEKMNELKNARI